MKVCKKARKINFRNKGRIHRFIHVKNTEVSGTHPMSLKLAASHGQSLNMSHLAKCQLN
jgi:hypothetical protein